MCKLRITNIAATILILIIGINFARQAQALEQTPALEVKIFRKLAGINPDIENIPTVVEVPLPSGNGNINNYALQAISDITGFQPFQIRQETIETRYIIYSGTEIYDAADLHDNNPQTYIDYPVEEPSTSQTWSFQYNQPIATNQFTFKLAQYAQEPVSVEISKVVQDKKVLILAETNFTGSTMRFPQTSSANFKVILTFNQPLRVAEMSFNQLGADTAQRYYLRFLASPGELYYLYADPATPAYLPYLETGNLLQAADVVVLDAPIFEANSFFTPPDSDKDGVLDEKDNCPAVPNTNQEDINNNYIGDACEDFDLDGILNTDDNCPDTPNRYQQDEDADGIGDHCDSEESRLTERLWWLPWAGIIVGFGVVITLLYTTIKKPQPTFKDHKYNPGG